MVQTEQARLYKMFIIMAVFKLRTLLFLFVQEVMDYKLTNHRSQNYFAIIIIIIIIIYNKLAYY
jgi:hypothetical protein